MSTVIVSLKDKVVASTTSLFSHGPKALEHTLDHRGDPGLLGPDSVSWRVIGDAAAFIGGIRALVVQTAHPEVVAGVEDHSRYRKDPFGRLNRTSVYVTETTYGAIAEVEAAVAAVRSAHRPVRGRSERDRPYSAGNPEMAAWVHNVLTDSFLEAFQTYGPHPLSAAEADRFVVEQARIGALLDASPLPETAEELSRWIAENPALASSAAQANALEIPAGPATAGRCQARIPTAVQRGHPHDPALRSRRSRPPPPARERAGRSGDGTSAPLGARLVAVMAPRAGQVGGARAARPVPSAPPGPRCRSVGHGAGVDVPLNACPPARSTLEPGAVPSLGCRS